MISAATSRVKLRIKQLATIVETVGNFQTWYILRYLIEISFILFVASNNSKIIQICIGTFGSKFPSLPSTICVQSDTIPCSKGRVV